MSNKVEISARSLVQMSKRIRHNSNIVDIDHRGFLPLSGARCGRRGQLLLGHLYGQGELNDAQASICTMLEDTQHGNAFHEQLTWQDSS